MCRILEMTQCLGPNTATCYFFFEAESSRSNEANKLSMGHFLAIFGRLSIRKFSPSGESLCVTTRN